MTTIRGDDSSSPLGEARDALQQAEARIAALTQELACAHELRARAESALRGREQFLSLLSHELRSPLNAILGWNRILMLKRTEDAEVSSATRRIEHSARAQLKMVNDLLDLMRLESGKLHIEPRPTQLSQVVGAAVAAARSAAEAKGITLLESCEAGSGGVLGDAGRLQQVISNLLSNAVKYTPKGGRIIVTVHDVGGWTQLSVEDSGQGVAPTLLPHLFDRRPPAELLPGHSGGLGLGLPLAREIVALHGGTISAHAAASGGAVFQLKLPLRARSQPSSGLQPCSADLFQVALGGVSVLVVDDELDARVVIAETLKLGGAEVAVADSASAAFALVRDRSAHFDVLITDIGMPGEDGYSLVKKLRAIPAGQEVLAIAVTGFASPLDMQKAMAAGFDLHVPKPVDLATFVPMVRRLTLERRVK